MAFEYELGDLADAIAEEGANSVYQVLSLLNNADPHSIRELINDRRPEGNCNNCGWVYYEDEFNADGNCEDCAQAIEDEEDERRLLEEEEDEL